MLAGIIRGCENCEKQSVTSASTEALWTHIMESITEVEMSERKRKDEASVARWVMNDNDNKTKRR